MSLVREALEKAEREAAARAARERGLPPRITATGQPYRSRRQRSTRAPILVALAVVALTAALFWWRGATANHEQVPSATARTGAEESSARDEVPTSPTEPSSDAADATTHSASPTQPLPTIATSAEPASPVAAASPAPIPSLESEASSEATPSGRRPPTIQKETFIRETTLESGATIRLGGIAWSAAAPLAYLNGKLLAVGESVAGCRIERIDRDRVELAQGPRRLILTLR